MELTERRRRDEVESLEAETAGKQSEAEGAWERAQTNLTAKYEQRKARIARAYKAAKKYALRRADDEEGRQKYAVQKGLLDTERNRVEGLQHNDATLADLQAQLAESEQSHQ